MIRLKRWALGALLLTIALTVAACGGRNAETTAEDAGPAAVERSPTDASVTAVDAPVANVTETEAASVGDVVVSDPNSGYTMILFAIEPLGAPCCPKPTPDKALEGAQGVDGVTDAWLIDDFTVFVRFDPNTADPGAIASAINQASFLVTEQEATPDELAALALTIGDADGESN